jgi:hypothetical protein
MERRHDGRRRDEEEEEGLDFNVRMRVRAVRLETNEQALHDTTDDVRVKAIAIVLVVRTRNRNRNSTLHGRRWA